MDRSIVVDFTGVNPEEQQILEHIVLWSEETRQFKTAIKERERAIKQARIDLKRIKGEV